MERYLNQVQDLSYKLSSLLAEAFGLPPNGLAHFYDTDELMQHRSKIVRYPVVEEGDNDQGVGPHYDAGFLTFVECLFVVLIFMRYLPCMFLALASLATPWTASPESFRTVDRRTAHSGHFRCQHRKRFFLLYLATRSRSPEHHFLYQP